MLTAEPRLQPLGPDTIAVSVYAGCHLTDANPYPAAFATGSVLATLDHMAVEKFEPFGDLLHRPAFIHDEPVARMLRIEPSDDMPAALTDADGRSDTDTPPLEMT